MAEEAAKKNKKGLIIGICAGALVLVAIIIAIVFAVRGGQLNDSYFVSDDSKYVLTLESDQLNMEEDEYEPAKTHIVYNYSGDEITGMTTYMEYADATAANKALEYYKTIDQEGVKNMYAKGKYVVVEMTEDQYENLTVSDVKSQIEFVEMLKNMDVDSEDVVDEDVEEEAEEEEEYAEDEEDYEYEEEDEETVEE